MTAMTEAALRGAAPRLRLARDDIVMRALMCAIGAFLMITLVLPLWSMLSKSLEDRAGNFVGLVPPLGGGLGKIIFGSGLDTEILTAKGRPHVGHLKPAGLQQIGQRILGEV